MFFGIFSPEITAIKYCENIKDINLMWKLELFCQHFHAFEQTTYFFAIARYPLTLLNVILFKYITISASFVWNVDCWCRIFMFQMNYETSYHQSIQRNKNNKGTKSHKNEVHPNVINGIIVWVLSHLCSIYVRSISCWVYSRYQFKKPWRVINL